MPDILEMAEILGSQRPEVKKLVRIAHSTPDMVDFIRRRLQTMLEKEGHDIHAPSPFAPYPEPNVLKVPGPLIGTVNQTGDDVSLAQEELKRGILVLGSHGSGKTNFGYWLVDKLVK